VFIAAGNDYEARPLLRDAMRLDDHPETQGRANLHLARSALRLGNKAEAERCARLARQQLPPAHPDAVEATLLLGKILQDAEHFAQAAECFDDVLKSSPTCAMAMLGRAVCSLGQHDVKKASAELHDLPQRAKGADAELEAALRTAEEKF